MKAIKKIIIFIIILGIIGVIGYLVYDKVLKNNESEVKVIKTIKDYGYELNDNETELYNKEFDKLEEILSAKTVDYEAYAKAISKLFIIDFYTLDNKLSKNDIGGVEYLKDSMKDDFIEEARSTFYRYLELKEERTQKLPYVSKIESVDVEKTTFTILDTTTTTIKTSYNKSTTTKSLGTEYEAYKVSISWDYKEDLDYETEANLMLIKDGKKLYIVEMD